MKISLLIILIFFCTTQLSYSQEDGVASLAIPVRNSLRFNRFNINPTFSFVREQNKYISFTNKREWVQFDDAPLTYLASYSGRFRENIGIGVGMFQQNYGVLTSFGGILNFAYNARLQQESNLTFGMNLGFYKSGINEGKVVTNVPDPSLNNIPSNFLLSISPGINYGTQFFDLGLSINNLVQYNMQSSELIEEDPQQSIQAHVMYTGYMDSGGFFDESKFSTLVRSEFKKDQTIISGIAMLTVPKGIWGQIGYNTTYGVSGGLGLNITSQIAIEYNFEKTIGELEVFGSSHEITLAFRFENKENYYYGGNDEEVALILPKKRKRVLAKPTESAADRAKRVEAKAKADEEAKLVAQADATAKAKADEEARVKAEELKAIELAAQAKKAEEAKLTVQAEAVAKAKADEEARIKAEDLNAIELAAKTKKEEEAKLVAQAEAVAKAKADEEARIKAEELKAIELAAKTKKEEEAKLVAQAEAVAQAKAVEEARIKAEELKAIELAAQAKKDEEAKTAAQAEAVAKAKADEEARIKAEELKSIELVAKAKQEEEAKIAKAKVEAQIAEEKLKEIELQAKAKRERLEAEEAVLLEITHKDDLAKAMYNITELAKASKLKQEDLLNRLDTAIEGKNKDLKDLKEENDLSEQGIYLEPKPFKSVASQNKALEALKIDVDNAIKERNNNIIELEKQYNDRLKTVSNKNDATNQYYSNTIQQLKNEQEQSLRAKTTLVSRLEKIDVDLEFERNRRIKKALFDNEEDRYQKDRITLNQIKQSTDIGTNRLLKEEDFDFGEERVLDNIQIVKDVKNIDQGYYVVLAVHSDVNKRNEFLTKAISAGQANVDFFYDVNSSKYFIYYEKFSNIETAKKAMQASNSLPYNSKMSIVKIEK
ncbi:MAG: hypothetical protein DA407_09010 [Bacteroidetes bacterium]|nr:MAG: hypothetical protein DA407_09010 [Bacteroidota bacterium]